MAQHDSDLRIESHWEPLRQAEVGDDPFVLFTAWLKEATAAGVHEPTAMTLATAAADGRPSARMVLLRAVDEQGFGFYTNYESRKAGELAENAWAALVFWWPSLHRQVRIEGQVERMSAAESDAYFATRPLGSQLAAWVSPQSRVIGSRAELEERLAELEAEYAGKQPPRPPFWGGFRVAPTVMEFWQGGPHRLHDRLRFTRMEMGGWRLERLAP
jgi:pyridoxamine 5'-phosphate oxidase